MTMTAREFEEICMSHMIEQVEDEPDVWPCIGCPASMFCDRETEMHICVHMFCHGGA